jgi:restriction endonuclease Mrr
VIPHYTPEIQKFARALQGQRARKGIFITTAKFSKEAVAVAKREIAGEGAFWV